MNPILTSCFQDRSILITGHTGFKGGWLATWLKLLGGRVIGYALPPAQDQPNLYEAARVEQNMASIIGDVRDYTALLSAFQAHEPEIVFHLAAQPIVRQSYRQPVETYAINTLGTVHLLEAVRQTPSVRVVVIVTSDKCYENREWPYAYRENDPLGGHDPYSASKAAAELVVASYRHSFFPPERFEQHHVSLASVRAGNVVGGGDWATDRIVPDCIRALVAGEQIRVRTPDAIRPWQHVLEPLAGYLWLAARMWQAPRRYAEAWNFGPNPDGHITVRDLVNGIIEAWGSGAWQDLSESQSGASHEAGLLKLDCAKTMSLLGWKPALSISECIYTTISWYHNYYFDRKLDGYEFTIKQIEDYVCKSRQSDTLWAKP